MKTQKISIMVLLISLSSLHMNADIRTQLHSLIYETREALNDVARSFELTKSTYSDKVKRFTKDLFASQKKRIKAIKQRLKQEYKSLKEKGDASFADKKALYKAYKNEVYKYWKNTQNLPLL
jgi:hypothetical protein